MFLSTALVLIIITAAGAGWASAEGDPAGEEVPYRILVTNDDGIDAPGLAGLVEALLPLGQVTIVAPLRNQSGIGHALNLSEPIFVMQREVAGHPATALTATPATCVRVAIEHIFHGRRPDLVVSGVNRGLNFGRNTYISGTVAAAREAALQGVPAIAASLAIEAHPNYLEAARATSEIAAVVKAHGLPDGVFLNVNVPVPIVKGLRLARQSRLAGTEHYVPRENPYGRRYLWSFFQQPTAAVVAGTDVAAVLNGYVAVTPLRAFESDEATIDWLAVHFPTLAPATATP